MPNYEFSCHCGAVKVTANQDPIRMFYCWCDSCTVAQGAAPAVAISMFREKAITISGPVEVISVTGAPDAAKRSACTKCHTKVVNIPKGGPPIRGCSPYQSKDRGVGWFKPQFHIFCADKMNTTGIHPSQINDGLPKYLGLPKSMGGDDKVITTNKM